MVERLLILKNDAVESGENRLTKSDSIQSEEEDTTFLVPGDRQRLKVAQLSTDISFDNSVSFDQEDPPTDNLLSEKLKRRKARRATEASVKSFSSSSSFDSVHFSLQIYDDRKKPPFKARPWYTKIDLTKPLFVLAFLFLIYFTWTKREVWIPRLLTSNTRIRRLDTTKQEQSNEKIDLSSSPSSSSSTSKSDREEGSSPSPSDEESNDNPTETKRKTKHLKTRRNKMSFSKDVEEPTKKRRRRAEVQGEVEDIPLLVKKQHHGKASRTKNKLVAVAHEEIYEQLKRLLKNETQSNEQFLSLLSKEFGVKKKKMKEFSKKNNYATITLEKFLSFLSRYQSTIAIVSK